MRDAFIQSLSDFTTAIEQLEDQVGYALNQTWFALSTLDKELAGNIITGDDEIDSLVRDCMIKDLNLCIMESPVGSDWRLLIASLKILTDLERIADHCADISHYVLHLTAEPDAIPMPAGMKDMYDVMISMAGGIMACYQDSDAEQASLLKDKDDIVDTAFNYIIEELAQKMKDDPNHIHQYISYVLITKYIERMADHASNIADWIIYKKSNKL